MCKENKELYYFFHNLTNPCSLLNILVTLFHSFNLLCVVTDKQQFQSAMCGYRQTTVSICFVWLQTKNSFNLLCVVTDKQQFQSAMCGCRQTTVSICYVWLQTNNSFNLPCVVTDKQQFQSAMYDYRQTTLLSHNPALGLTWYI